MTKTETLHWVGDPDGHLRMIDQTLLPSELSKSTAVRRGDRMGSDRAPARPRAPAIGIAAAYGVCVGLQTLAGAIEAAFCPQLEEVAEYLATAGLRPSISSGPSTA